MFSSVLNHAKYLLNLSTNSSICKFLDRTSFDIEVMSKCKNMISSEYPTISAIYRVKNGAATIEASILSVAPICREIVVIDNKSTDNTIDIVKRLKVQLGDVCDIKLFHFNDKVHVAGSEYLNDIHHSEGVTLAKFYSTAFSYGSSNYLMKVDAHCIFTFSGLERIIRKLKERPRFIIFRGVEIFGKKLSYEAYIFKNDDLFYYEDSPQYELLKFKYKITFFEKLKCTIFTPVFIHLKRLIFLKVDVTNNPAKELYK